MVQKEIKEQERDTILVPKMYQGNFQNYKKQEEMTTFFQARFDFLISENKKEKPEKLYYKALDEMRKNYVDNVSPREMYQIRVLLGSVKNDLLEGKEINYEKAIGNVKESNGLNEKEITQRNNEKMADLWKMIEQREKVSRMVASKTIKNEETQEMKPVENKKVEIEMLAITFPFGENNNYKVYMVDNDGSIQKQFKEARNDQERKYVLEANKYSIYKSETIFDIGTKKEIVKSIERGETITNIEQKGGLFQLKISDIKREKVSV